MSDNQQHTADLLPLLRECRSFIVSEMVGFDVEQDAYKLIDKLKAAIERLESERT